MSASFIGLDLGGSKLATGLVRDGRLHGYSTRAVAANGTEQEVIAFLLAQIDSLMDASVRGIGIGVPGVVDTHAGIVYDTANIPAWKKVPLKDILQERLQLPVQVNNDVNCFVLGEKRFGKASDCHNVVGLCLGTGMGAGIIINDKLYGGRNGGAGELGSIAYRDSVLENYCSGQFFSAFHQTSGHAAYVRACVGDAQALAQFREFGEHVGNAIATTLLAYDPEMIVLGGSLANAWPYFIDAVHGALERFPYRQTIRRLRIERSDAEHIAVLGAAALFHDAEV